MMKKLLLLAAIAPCFAFAQPLNTLNNPNLPDYQIPSQQRMQTQMQTQQIQHKGMLNQQLQTQTRQQQQHLNTQLNSNSQRTLNAQPQQMLPNNDGGMLNTPSQKRMLPSNPNGSMLNQNAPTTP